MAETYGNVKENVRKGLVAVEAVIDRWFGLSFDGTKLAIAMPNGTTPNLKRTLTEWEEFCDEYAFEYIDTEDPRPSVRKLAQKSVINPPIGKPSKIAIPDIA
jgi:hypothetical protein